MVTVELYYYNGIPQVINKNLSKVQDIEGTFRQPMQLLDPTFQFSGSDIQNLLTSGAVNYFGIDGKYYYLVDWSIQPNNMIQVRLHIDVLYTYRSEIANMEIMLERSSTNPNEDIQDSQHPLGMNRQYQVQKYPRGFSDEETSGTYILVTSQTGYSPV